MVCYCVIMPIQFTLEQAKGRLREMTVQFNRRPITKAQKADLIIQAIEVRKLICRLGGTPQDIAEATYGK